MESPKAAQGHMTISVPTRLSFPRGKGVQLHPKRVLVGGVACSTEEETIEDKGKQPGSFSCSLGSQRKPQPLFSESLNGGREKGGALLRGKGHDAGNPSEKEAPRKVQSHTGVRMEDGEGIP